MEFDWERAVERNLDDLLRIVARLFFMAGIRTGRSLVYLPRGLRARILSVLRPAEFAARRLVAMAACKLVTVVTRKAEPRGRQSPAIPGTDCEDDGTAPSIPGLEPRTGDDPRDHSLNAAPAPEPKNSALTVILRDDDPDEGKRPVGPADDGKRGQPDAAPSDAELLDLYRDRPSFALFDPWKRYAPFLFDVTGLDGPFGHVFLEYDEDEENDWPDPDRDPGELVDARALSRRIRALALALDDLDGQAARLARWRARFAHAIERIQLADAGEIKGLSPDAVRRPSPWRFRPFRPAPPPGWRRRPRSEIGEVLKECHTLALDAWNTS
ncbi:hypothetical protein [Oricola thermophila]|uniref:Uncharacterized protein n=1 Tax=Oricola thermophila TaxID=2742145 RepID=A0A6N1VDV8_9HYPH|nr:hypothetical protein [Oricola thermophila]QKV17227.1 hypothetical protein HTY61_01465 [Oricola thermophila]